MLSSKGRSRGDSASFFGSFVPTLCRFKSGKQKVERCLLTSVNKHLSDRAWKFLHEIIAKVWAIYLIKNVLLKNY
ncbi:hypothetical protein BBM70_11535 [Vibrio parahaemolyticus]|nr:hypothetical protein BBM70_11535 [Vibrio parahaemolyticus]TPA69477.1 hypothetical protein DXJ88_22135 [Vibrio parahaemolyticus]